MRLAPRSQAFRILAIALGLAGASIMPAVAQVQEGPEHGEQQRGRAAARAALEIQAEVEASRVPQARQAQSPDEMDRERIQRQPQARSGGGRFQATDEGPSPLQVRSLLEQQERARQARDHESSVRMRGEERDRQRSEVRVRGQAQRNDVGWRQQRGREEFEAAERLRHEREQRRDREHGREPLVLDSAHRPQLRPSDALRGTDSRQRLDRAQQEHRIAEERHRAQRYHRQRATYHHLADERARMLQQQRRMAQYHYQQQYYQRLRQQQARWGSRRHDYYGDPYYYTPASLRYSYGGRWHQTNRHGAELMRQAVDYGYREGLRAGRADRHDQWRSDYRNSYAYQDASYGYNGYYVGHDVYSHYFRQGFERGYQDAYHDRYRYGRRNSDGEYGVIAAVVTAILGLQLLR